MGTWSAEILGNDSAMDLYGFFEKLYNKQELNIDEVKRDTLSKFGLFNDDNEPVYGNEEWLAYALACWEYKAIDNETIKIVANILNDKEEIKEDWEDLANDRIKEIEQFYIKIQTPPKRKKRIKKEYIVEIPFKIGDCILTTCENGKYSITILLDINKKKDRQSMWTYYFATTRIYSKDKPTIETIKNSHFLVVNYGKTWEGKITNYYVENPTVWISGSFMGSIKNEKEKQEKEKELLGYEIITNLNFTTIPELPKSFGSFRLDSDYFIKTQSKWEEQNTNSIDLSYPIKNYIKIPEIVKEKPKKKKWQFWK